jgi:hypothetical protein
MNIDGAVIKEQGVTFGIVVVKSHVLNSGSERDAMVSLGRQSFGFIPIVLMTQDSRGVPTYWGRPDIVRFLANIHFSQIPWKRYTLAA